MFTPRHAPSTATQQQKLLQSRIAIVHGALLLCVLIIVARLLELQIVRGEEYHAQAQAQHYGGVVLPARRGEVLATNSKTGETSILATNTTLDMVYVDPLGVDDAALVAETLARTLLTNDFHQWCTDGDVRCPRELVKYYAPAYDPLAEMEEPSTGSGLLAGIFQEQNIEPRPKGLPDLTEARRQFERDIEERIVQKKVRFVPLLYGGTKAQLNAIRALRIQGVHASFETGLISADPEEVDQSQLPIIAQRIGNALELDPASVHRLLRSRSLRYVSIMHRLTPELSLRLKELKRTASRNADSMRALAIESGKKPVRDPLRGVALLPEHWRLYPDGNIGAQLVGFLNTSNEAQYGIERTYDAQLRGQEGRIAAVTDTRGGQIVTGGQTVVDPQDGDAIVLTIDRFVQKSVEEIMQRAIEFYDADSGQAIVLEPETGRILAMVNVPLFDSNYYGNVYKKEPVTLTEAEQHEIVVEIYHPTTHEFVLRGYIGSVFSASGRTLLSEEKQQELAEIEELYALEDSTRYYLYDGDHSRREVFPTEKPEIWLKYKNNIGIGTYVNRTIQEIYEPGSVFKAITMAAALDQGEILPSDTYLDEGPVEVDEYTIRNALNVHYDEVTMTNCLEYSVNTCMTSVSERLGRKLFHRIIERFGFGRVTGIALEDELPGEVLPWRKWSNALLATASYGQGISATPLQMVTAFAALANDGKLMRPIAIDRILRSDGTVERAQPHVVDQVITAEAAETITAMLTSTVENGFAKTAKVPGYRIAGKTGTSQIAGPGGKYETGTGSSITSFAGYAPVHDPKFVALVKLDRPRTEEYGSKTAAPVFRQIAAFLLQYYGVPPDDV